MLDIIVLAAGKGTRMRSGTPKVLHTLAGKPFLQHVIDRANQLDARTINVVVGHGAAQVKKTINNPAINYVEQTQQLGTGHAVLQALPHIDPSATVLILYGDVPLITGNTLRVLLNNVSEHSLGLLTLIMRDPTGYGRIVRDSSEQVVGIVEHKDASDMELAITEVNTGVMAVKGEHLQRWLPALSNDNVQGEYYLTDIIAMAKDQSFAIVTSQPASESETFGINNRQQQAQLERIYQSQLAEQLMDEGVTLIDPARFDCRGSLTTGNDCLIDVNCVFEGDVRIGNNVSIGPNCHIIDAIIGDNCVVKSHTVIEGALIEQDVFVGPFARLRPQTQLKSGAKVGNFVEIKKAVIGIGSKVSHLSYIGDAELGKDVNIGAGTITCNYDGVNKFLTKIEDGVFVGSNTALVAPVCLGEGSTIGAGSVITSTVEAGQLAVSRSKQANYDHWTRPVKKKP
ncbi:MAG: bifunctional UDP-N-acetylglucosamine pyrophosphorylase/glucosamine-1-phosphate N-acetyltransferase [Lentisphaeria bacterium]|jgi:bifunctional UDP-N-acetylglucosamine pyrophosphorylase/glucosamine-1-phosphate N-acetyltransferase